MSDKPTPTPAPIAEPTKLTALLEDLDAGTFDAKVSQALKDVAIGVVANGKKGKVTIQFDLKRIGNTNQVEMVHKLVYARPTANGKVTAEDATTTPLHVGSTGSLSLFPETQQSLPGMERERGVRTNS